MININKVFLLDQLQSFGINLELEVNQNTNGVEIILIPSDFNKTEGFIIKTSVEWRSVSSKIEFGNYALPLLKALESASIEKKQVSISFAKGALKKGYSFSFKINDSKINFDSIETWPSEWKTLIIEMKSKPFDSEDESDLNSIILFEQQSILYSIISLLEITSIVEENKNESFEFEKLPEGAKSKVEVNKYERNPLNRLACIEFYGSICQVCEFDFKKKYGPIGKGYIHVHHIIPLSKLGGAYIINPILDLIPVCPNCHYMLHKKDPPFSIDELKKIIHTNFSD